MLQNVEEKVKLAQLIFMLLEVKSGKNIYFNPTLYGGGTQ